MSYRRAIMKIANYQPLCQGNFLVMASTKEISGLFDPGGLYMISE